MIKIADQVQATMIARSIQQRGLQIGVTLYGVAAWAFHIDMVPRIRKHEPMVIFDVDEQYVEEFNKGRLRDGRRYFTLKLRGNLGRSDYVPIRVLGFRNLPQLFIYPGSIGYFD